MKISCWSGEVCSEVLGEVLSKVVGLVFLRELEKTEFHPEFTRKQGYWNWPNLREEFHHEVPLERT